MPRDLHLILVRHAQSTWNINSRLAGWTDVPLTDLGRRQALAVRPHLNNEHIDAVWSSDLVRAIDTARIAYGEPTQDRRLRELNFGQLEGIPWLELGPEWTEKIKDFERFEAPEGESMAVLQTRLMDFVDGLDPGRHLIFTHGGVIRLFSHLIGESGFVANGTVVGIDWTRREKLFERLISPHA